MRPSARDLLLGFAKLVGVIAIGGAVGAALGLGLSALSGDDKAPSQGSAATATPAPAASRATIAGVTLTPYTSASGRRRKRARLTVRAKVTNGGGQALVLARPAVVVAAGRTAADPNADSFAGALLKPIAPGRTATGVLRFETAGAVTTQLTRTKAATLLIGKQRLKLTL